MWQPDPLVLINSDQDEVVFVRDAVSTARIANPLITCRTASEVRRLAVGPVHPICPTLFLLNPQLHGVESGLDLLRWIRQQPGPFGTTPTLILTRALDAPLRRAIRELGVKVCLEQPVTQAQMIVAIQSLGYMVTTGLISTGSGFRVIHRTTP